MHVGIQPGRPIGCAQVITLYTGCAGGPAVLGSDWPTRSNLTAHRPTSTAVGRTSAASPGLRSKGSMGSVKASGRAPGPGYGPEAFAQRASTACTYISLHTILTPTWQRAVALDYGTPEGPYAKTESELF